MNERPTPETDEQINGKPCTRFAIMAGDSLRDALVPSEFARKLERERDEARHLVNVAESIQRKNEQDVAELKQELSAMREAIKAAHRFIQDIVKNHECGNNVDACGESALSKLQPFLTDKI